jgi:hypothetical protein
VALAEVTGALCRVKRTGSGYRQGIH